MFSISFGLLGPASITSILTFGFSARRLATAHPAVPPGPCVCDTSSSSSRLAATPGKKERRERYDRDGCDAPPTMIKLNGSVGSMITGLLIVMSMVDGGERGRSREIIDYINLII